MELIDLNSKQENCKGLVFKGKIIGYMTKVGEYIYQKRMYLLKKQSCNNCNQCIYLMDQLKEDISDGILPSINIEHGKL